MAAKRMVVAGGNGFLGSQICRAAVGRGWEVVSFSGEPDWSTLFQTKDKPRWAKKVEWAKGDILKPETYRPLLKDTKKTDAVVHSMGILLEADYKGLVSGKEGPLSVLRRMMGGEVKSEEQRKPAITYGKINRDSAMSLAKETHDTSIPTFLYISAAAGAPLLPSGYINSKREAESLISTNFPHQRNIFLRPTFIYSANRKISIPIAMGGYLGHEANLITKGKLSDWGLGTMVEKPMKVDMVGRAVVEALEDESVRGVVAPKEVERLGFKGWRKSML
ncbi:hypothetical protein KEM55_004767 [Ascosphaera atra]|nr:hypothetical protein KEM55_004767 [Ascosphaera atra]